MSEKYSIGDKLLIRSKIMPWDTWEMPDDSCVKVCTSCSNGWDRFNKEGLQIEDGFVVHEVVVKNIYEHSKYGIVYHCSNNLSTTGMGWQGVSEKDIIQCLKRAKDSLKEDTYEYTEEDFLYDSYDG